MHRHLPLLAMLSLVAGCTRATTESTVPVGDLSLHIICQGEGVPPVILEAGLGNDSRVWSSVMPGVAKSTQVCAYDRAGTGASSGPVPKPHSNRQMAEELRGLLQAAGIAEPFVLVGHSMGGANVRYLTATAPQSVAGMVLVDASNEHQPARLWALLPEPTLNEFKAALSKSPEGIDFDTFRQGLEGLSTASPSLGNLPLVVLSHGKPSPPPPGVTPELNQRLEREWQRAQEALATLSTNSAHVVVRGAGHHIQIDRPEAVVAAIEEVLDAIRQQRRVDSKQLARRLD